MKVGDLVRFTRDHASQDGFEYCKDWIGLVTKREEYAVLNDMITIHWTCPHHGAFFAEYMSDDEFLEVLSEKG
mgnify:FL=1